MKKTPGVVVFTEQELRDRRKALLASVPFDEEDLRLRGAEYMLWTHEQAVIDELDQIDFLLGEDRRGR